MRKWTILLAAGVLFCTNAYTHAAHIQWATLGSGTVPGSTTAYTLTSTSDGDLPIAAGGTGDGEHTWDAGGTNLRKRGGEWNCSIAFDAPVPADKLTFVFNDVDLQDAVITVTVTGNANTQDFAIDPGFSYRPDFNYDPTTGQLTPPPGVTDNTSQLFGMTTDTVTSISIQAAGLLGDWTSAFLGFVVADPLYTIDKVVLDDTLAEITSAEVGDDITYRITLANIGGVDLSGIEVTDTLPDYLQYNASSATPSNPSVAYNPGPPATVTWPVGSVVTGGSASLDIDMTILADADEQTLTNQALVTAIDAPAASGKAASVNLDVGDVQQPADITISSWEVDDQFSPDLVGFNMDIYYTLTITNNGPAFADNEVAFILNDFTVLEINGEVSTRQYDRKSIKCTNGMCVEQTQLTGDDLPVTCPLMGMDTNDTFDIEVRVEYRQNIDDHFIRYNFELRSNTGVPVESYDILQGQTKVGGNEGSTCFISSALGRR